MIVHFLPFTYILGGHDILEGEWPPYRHAPGVMFDLNEKCMQLSAWRFTAIKWKYLTFDKKKTGRKQESSLPHAPEQSRVPEGSPIGGRDLW